MRRFKNAILLSTILGCVAVMPVYSLAQGTQRSINDDLMYRISFGRVDDVKGLLEKGAEPNIYGAMGDTPLILAMARNPNEADEMVRAILVKGGDPNFPDKNGIYPLEVAIKNDRPSIVRILIDSGADIHMKSQTGMTMIDLANKFDKQEVVQAINDKLKKESEMEAQMHDPARLLPLIHQFSTSVCELNYWNNYLFSEQNPKDNESSREKIAKSKELGEKVGGEIARYFPNVKLASYVTFSGDSITAVFKSLRDNKTRAENGIGTDDDAHKRCKPIADASRDSIAQVLNAQKKAAEDAAKAAELSR